MRRLAPLQAPFYAALVVVVATALCYPLTQVYWFESHELFDYVTRTVEYAEALRQGELYPRWSPSFYGGYGSPFFNFYAPLVYALAGAGTLLLGSPTLALKLVVLLASLLAGLGTFAWVQLETRRADAAFVAACLYLAAPYRLADLSWRGDIAELFALSILPIALYAYRRIALADDPKSLPRLTLYAVLAHVALVLSHTILALWGTGLIAVVALLSAWQAARHKRAQRAWLFVQAFGFGLLGSSIYTLPALGERAHVRTEVMVQTWTAPLNNLLATAALFRPGAHAIGPLLLVACALVALALLLTRRRALPASIAALAACALVLLALPIAAPIWKSRLIPFGDYIQFPWRLFGPAALCASVACGLAWPLLLPSRHAIASWAAPLLALLVSAGALQLARPQTALYPMVPQKIMLSPARIQAHWIRGTALDEYLPRAVTRTSDAVARHVATSTASTTITLAESTGARHALELDIAAPTQLELALHAFPGWAVETEEGPSAVALDTSAQGLVRLRFATPGHYALNVAFGATPLRKLAAALSALGLLLAYPLAAYTMRARRAHRQRARRFVHESSVHGASA